MIHQIVDFQAWKVDGSVDANQGQGFSYIPAGTKSHRGEEALVTRWKLVPWCNAAMVTVCGGEEGWVTDLVSFQKNLEKKSL